MESYHFVFPIDHRNKSKLDLLINKGLEKTATDTTTNIFSPKDSIKASTAKYISLS
jgi:hypothetical protein